MRSLFYVDSSDVPAICNTREEADTAATLWVLKTGQGVDIYEMTLLGRMEPVLDPVRFVPVADPKPPASSAAEALAMVNRAISLATAVESGAVEMLAAPPEQKPRRGRPAKNEPNVIQERAEVKAVIDDHDPFADRADDDPPSQIVTIDAKAGSYASGEWICPACRTNCFASQRACACGQARPMIPLDEAKHEFVPGPQKSDEEMARELDKKNDEEAETLLRNRCGKDDEKCVRCGAATIGGLVNGFNVRLCPKTECVVSPETAATYNSLYGDPLASERELPKFSGAAKGGDSNLQPEAAPEKAAAGVAAALAKREEVLSDIAKMERAVDANPGVPLSHIQIPNEDDVAVVSHEVFLGITVELPPAEWEDEPITETGGESGGGQLKALNTALTEAGYGSELRHRACIAILGQVRSLDSLKELTKAEAQVLLTWLDKAQPEDIAELSKVAGPQKVRI